MIKSRRVCGRGRETDSHSVVILRYRHCDLTIFRGPDADLDSDPRAALALHIRTDTQPTINLDHRAATAGAVEIDRQIVQRGAHGARLALTGSQVNSLLE